MYVDTNWKMIVKGLGRLVLGGFLGFDIPLSDRNSSGISRLLLKWAKMLGAKLVTSRATMPHRGWGQRGWGKEAATGHHGLWCTQISSAGVR